MLIDTTYFTGGARHILNAATGKFPNPAAAEVDKAITDYIRVYQEPFLTGMLGSEVARRVGAYLEDGGSEDPLLDDLCERLRESFADYVFYHILGESNSQATITGLVELKCANRYVSPARRQTLVWNRMVDRNRALNEWYSDGCPLKGLTMDPDLTAKINVLNI